LPPESGRARDAVTLQQRGIALAEHVAKTIICGADAIIADIPLLLSLECRMCKECANGEKNPCPIDLKSLNVKRGAQRVVNLVGAWNNQLLEVMGAMGLREVRRLRGEVGRACSEDLIEICALSASPKVRARRLGMKHD
jgi:glutamate synthase domain-containing protein 2